MVALGRFIALLQLECEELFLECKASLPGGELKQKIAKTAMWMANIRDGGTIIIGVPTIRGVLCEVSKVRMAN